MMNPAKKHPSFSALPPTPRELVAADVPVIIRYRPTATRGEGFAMARGLATRYSYGLIPAIATTLPMDRIDILTEDPEVEMIYPDLPVHTMLDQSVPIIRAPQVWALGDTGKGITVAIVDTGVDGNHPDLVGRLVATQDFSGEGYKDNHGHGTHVAGIIGGSGAASNGKYKGVAPDVTLMAAKVLKGNGSGLMSDVMAGVEWAVQQKAHVINLSLGGPPMPCDGTDALSLVCDAAVRAGAVVCVAAGNSGPGEKTVGAPGCAREVITVGASVSGPTDYDTITSFSSRGPTSDGRTKPDICFPGQDIISARASETAMGHIIDDHYTQASGTSMATPHCAGAAALLLAANPGLTPTQVKARLLRGARQMTIRPNTPLGGNLQGAGRADVLNAYHNEAGTPLPPAPEGPPSNGGGQIGCLPSILTFWVLK